MERTSALVRGARKTGETRVVEGAEAARTRNDAVRLQWADGGAAMLKDARQMLATESQWVGWGLEQ
jgi:hypothetical protein